MILKLPCSKIYINIPLGKKRRKIHTILSTGDWNCVCPWLSLYLTKMPLRAEQENSKQFLSHKFLKANKQIFKRLDSISEIYLNITDSVIPTVISIFQYKLCEPIWEVLLLQRMTWLCKLLACSTWLTQHWLHLVQCKPPFPSWGAAKFLHCYTIALLVALHEVQQLLGFSLAKIFCCFFFNLIYSVKPRKPLQKHKINQTFMTPKNAKLWVSRAKNWDIKLVHSHQVEAFNSKFEPYRPYVCY